MTEIEYQAILQKVEREFPIRCKLSEMLGESINPKNEKQLLAFDATIAELFLRIGIESPELMVDAVDLIRPLYSED